MFVKPGHLTYVHSICCTYCKNEVNRNIKTQKEKICLCTVIKKICQNINTL